MFPLSCSWSSIRNVCRSPQLRKDFLNSPFDILVCSTALASQCLSRTALFPSCSLPPSEFTWERNYSWKGNVFLKGKGLKGWLQLQIWMRTGVWRFSPNSHGWDNEVRPLEQNTHTNCPVGASGKCRLKLASRDNTGLLITTVWLDRISLFLWLPLGWTRMQGNLSCWPPRADVRSLV